jgi:Putative Actinobacterial Holin-X, holin superfamily III
MADQQGPGIQNLVGEALRESSDLARKELTLFKAELAENLKTLAIGAALMAAAGIFAIAALILFTEALVEWLATVVDSEALAALIVGGVMAIIAVGLVFYGRSTMSATSLAPNRSIKSIQRDKQVLSESVAS